MHLDDLVKLLPDLRVMSVHGLGRGGGEKVAQEIVHLYSVVGKTVKIVSSDELEICRVTEQGVEQNKVRLLLTSGLRDIPAAIRALALGVPYAVYLQVPYLKAASWRDPVHAIATLFMLLLHRFAARAVFCNSTNTESNLLGRSRIVLPIRRPISHKMPAPSRQTKKRNMPKSLVFVTACRLFRERGRGARDLNSLARFSKECHAYSSQYGVNIQVIHYGDVAPEIKVELKSCGLVFRGYEAQWTTTEFDACFFFSNYEGFGLAAYEAAQSGCDVVVNEAFPVALLDICENIRQIDTSNTSVSILEQVLDAYYRSD